MATFRKRKTQSGYTWQAIIRKRNRKPIVRSFDYREDAEKWARSVEREIDTNSFIPSDVAERTTLKTVLERYLCWCVVSRERLALLRAAVSFAVVSSLL